MFDPPSDDAPDLLSALEQLRDTRAELEAARKREHDLQRRVTELALTADKWLTERDALSESLRLERESREACKCDEDDCPECVRRACRSAGAEGGHE